MIAGGEVDRKERILPNGASELVINLSTDEIRIYDSIEPERYRRLSGAVLSGTYSGVFICDATQHQCMLGVHFRPGGAFPFIGAPATELTDAHVNLEDLWGSPARLLQERLRAATTVRKRFQLLEEALLEHLRLTQRRHHAIEAAIRRLAPAGTVSSTRGLAQELGLSQRRFIQLFAIHAGLTPKLLCRILRFQRARTLAEAAERSSLRRLERQPSRGEIDWAEIALACGYYDQSHLVKDFQNLAGLSPGEYIRKLRSARNLKENHLPATG